MTLSCEAIALGYSLYSPKVARVGFLELGSRVYDELMRTSV